MENQKIVAVWLTRAERCDEKIRERLRALRAEYKPKKYTVCEYHSGDGDLKTSILDLLEYNKLRSAEREIEQEKAAREQSAPAKEHDLRLQRKRRTSAMERWGQSPILCKHHLRCK